MDPGFRREAIGDFYLCALCVSVVNIDWEIMPERKIGVIIDGATGRLGTTQHLKALLAIRGEGGLPWANGDRLMPEPVLLGRDPDKLAALAARSGGLRWSADRDACLADPAVDIYFDAGITGGRPERGRAAFAAGK